MARRGYPVGPGRARGGTITCARVAAAAATWGGAAPVATGEAVAGPGASLGGRESAPMEIRSTVVWICDRMVVAVRIRAEGC